MWEIWVLSLGQEDTLEKGMALPTEVCLPGELHGQRSLAGYSSWTQRAGHDWAINIFTFFHFSTVSIGHVLENADTQHYSTMDSTEYLESDKSRFKISTLLPFSWVTLDKLLDLPESQFPHLWHVTITISPLCSSQGLLQESNAVPHRKSKLLAHISYIFLKARIISKWHCLKQFPGSDPAKDVPRYADLWELLGPWRYSSWCRWVLLS